MIPNVLIDTDVLLDVFLEREPHYTNSKNVLYLLNDGSFHGFITATIVVNVFYHMEKYKNLEMAFECVEDLLTNRDIVILGVDKPVLMAALRSGMADFEDAVQAMTAHVAGLDYIVTRNKRDFRVSPITAVSPEELLNKLNEEK
jgi:predicted nucleic-acid-binding protein